MKIRFTILLLLFTTILFNKALFAVDVVGDYRSNVATTGLWSAASSWQRFDGVSWVAAVTAPINTDGVITIRSGDSIRLNDVRTIDQVVVEGSSGAGNQGVLAIFITPGTVTVTLNNGSGDDISVNAFGRLYISAGATVSGAGTIYVNPGGLFTLRNSGVLNVPVTSDGDINFGQPAISAGTILGVTVISNNTATWIDGILTLSTGGNLTNNGTFTAANTNNIVNTGGGNTITNTGTILKTAAGGIWGPPLTNSGTINCSGSVTYTSMINSSTGILTGTTTQTFTAINNSGTLAGTGTFVYPAGGTNTGSIAPGNSPGILNANPNTIVGTSTNIKIEVLDGSGMGTGNDVLNITGAVASDLTGVTLSIIDISPVLNPAPIQTYDVMTTTGTFTGTPTLNFPTNYVYFGIVGGNIVRVQKIALFPLPLVWGDFTALVKNTSQVQVKWSTMQEQNVSYFTVEYSTNGVNYIPIGTVTAAGNTFERTEYSFLHTAPDVQKTNYYRIKQTDIDAKSTYSVIRPVRFTKGYVVPVLATPNPVKDILQLSVQVAGIHIILSDMSGKMFQALDLQPGVHTINMEKMHAGMYQLTIYEKGERVESQKIIKL